MLKYCWFFNAPEYCNYDTIEEGENAISQKPVTFKPVTSNPVNTNPFNTNPINLNPINSNPVTSKPVTSNPVTSNPVNSNPVNSNPINSIPVDINFSNPNSKLYQLVGVGSASIGVQHHPHNNSMGISIAINSTFSTEPNSTTLNPSMILTNPFYQLNTPDPTTQTSISGSPSSTSSSTFNPSTSGGPTTSKPTTLSNNNNNNNNNNNSNNNTNSIVYINSNSTMNPFPVFTTPTTSSPPSDPSASFPFVTTEKVKL